ncbi:MAG: hypothetical protein QOE36_3100 [Gaiellaceae bacterium]|jgi:hypothetical protein|nr:hypothetical protein [Gaiellaceae bacterium]
MRAAAAAAILLVALGGCGSHGADSPATVVRAWSHALNTGDNVAAAALFARGAAVIQGQEELQLRTRADAVRWNAALPCSGKIVALVVKGETVTATFLLGDRPSSPCDGPGRRARALLRIHGGKIVLWHQLPSGPPAPSGSVV